MIENELGLCCSTVGPMDALIIQEVSLATCMHESVLEQDGMPLVIEKRSLVDGVRWDLNNSVRIGAALQISSTCKTKQFAD